MVKLVELGYESLTHPPNSPNLALCLSFCLQAWKGQSSGRNLVEWRVFRSHEDFLSRPLKNKIFGLVEKVGESICLLIGWLEHMRFCLELSNYPVIQALMSMRFMLPLLSPSKKTTHVVSKSIGLGDFWRYGTTAEKSSHHNEHWSFQRVISSSGISQKHKLMYLTSFCVYVMLSSVREKY